MEVGKAYLLVRSQVVEATDRPKFDEWYRTHHLAFAAEKLRAEKAWRFWCQTDPAIHFALYQFRDVAHATESMGSKELEILLADFDQSWPNVARTREVMELVQA